MIDAPHGVCLAACTNIGLGFNLKPCENDLASLDGVTNEIDEAGAPRGSAERFLSNIQVTIRKLNFPSRPSDLGIKKEDARTLLNKTLVQTRRIKTNPRPLGEELLSFIKKGI
jgi:alcohol dehydrogenase class IV